jgi:hypothetical protein
MQAEVQDAALGKYRGNTILLLLFRRICMHPPGAEFGGDCCYLYITRRAE